MENLREEMGALEKAGCERIVVDSASHADAGIGMFPAVVASLSAGDALVVWNLLSVANSLGDLVSLVLQLEMAGVRFRSLTERFDTHGQHRAAVKVVFALLQDFERTLRREKDGKGSQARRGGRPRSLSADNIKRVRQLVKEGRAMDDVAREFNISRGTLYRYLGE
jgi:DNA invertase Pin-like site-specific DNA recombinase